MYLLVPLFTALIAAGTFIKIPMVPVPITLQTLFVFLAALLLNPSGAFLSVALYILLGAIGLPIFTSGGGLAALLGPTGGFLFSMPIAALFGALVVKKDHDSIIRSIIAIIVMEIIIYTVGVGYLVYTRHMTIYKGLMAGFVPFIPGDLIKIVVAIVAAKYIYPEKEKLVAKRKSREE